MTAPKGGRQEFPVRSPIRKLVYGSLLRFVPDALFLRCQYRCRTGEPLNLEAPRTFNEKTQWLKLHYRRPELTAPSGSGSTAASSPSSTAAAINASSPAPCAPTWGT